MTERMGPAERASTLERISPAQARENHVLLQEIFASEIEYRASDSAAEHFENLYWCAYLLFCVGDPADVPMMWSAKHINFDTACGFDIQFLLGGGVDQTLEYLRSHGHQEIADALLAYEDELRSDLAEWSTFRHRYFYGE
jgi:hypothetical protein